MVTSCYEASHGSARVLTPLRTSNRGTLVLDNRADTVKKIENVPYRFESYQRAGQTWSNYTVQLTGVSIEYMNCNAAAFADGFEKKGYRIVSGGTDNHLVLVDLRPKNLTGDIAEKTLESVGIVVNRNVIPGDPQRPDVTSGIRVGSPGITTRGMGTAEVGQIVELMDIAMVNRKDLPPRAN